MAEPEEWEFASLRWIHQVREAEYHKTKDRPIGAWLKPVDPRKVMEACRRMGLNVKTASPKRDLSGRYRSPAKD